MTETGDTMMTFMVTWDPRADGGRGLAGHGARSSWPPNLGEAAWRADDGAQNTPNRTGTRTAGTAPQRHGEGTGED